tara:strand:+ start:3959 stop:7060 length:3102 start_codon:yes stop_codon:yes gene_type:complete
MEMKFKINLRQKLKAESLFLLALLYAFGMQSMLANKIDSKKKFENNLQFTVTGVVNDDNGTPLPGASVVVKGTTTGTVTDFDGKYSIEVGTDGILVFSYLGYKTVEVAVNGNTNIDATLPLDATQLDDVVVVGYGTQKKSEVTSSISQIDGEDFQTSTASNAAMALQGRASGVEFVNSGTPGSTPSIRIRGVGTINNSQPLIVLDGVPVDSNVLAQLASSEIQSVEILKDAASGAIYGTRAANGVVLITTNNARFNEKTTVRLNASTGFNSVIKKYPVTNAEQLYELKRERYTMDGLPIDPNSPWADEYYNQTRTDWQDEMFRDGLFQDYNMNISGGSEKSTINANIFYRDEEGTQINTYLKRLGISMRGTQKISDRFRIEENIRITNNHTLLTQDDGATGTSQTIYSSYRYMPAIPVKYEDGSYGSGQASTQLGDMWNPVYKAKEEWRHRYRFNTLVSLKADYDITDALTLTARASYQKSTSKFEGFQNITPNQSRTINQPILTINTDETNVALGELFTSYTKSSEKHNIGAVLGISGQLDKGSYMNMSGEGFASVDKNQLVMDNASLIRGNGNDYLATGLASAFVRGTYAYSNKYYLSAIFRADGSSRFADGNRWGYFPSISGGWRISNENFMKDNLIISNMKLNVGWGQLGNQNVSAFQYLNTYNKDIRYVLNDTNLTGTRLATFANPDITWETTSALNILLELGLFKNKLHLDVAYFDRLTSDMLIPLPGLNTAGLVAIPDSNIGEMRNSGFEIEPSYSGQVGDLSFELGVNATIVKNEVTKLYGSSKFISGGAQTRTYEGEPISSFYGWKTDGIYQNQTEIDNDANISLDPRKADITPGDVRFVDTNGDNIIDEQDRVHIGDANPSLLLGFHADLNYKGFDFSAVFSGAFGHELYDAMMMRGIDPTQSANMDAVAYQRWTGEGTSNKYPRMSTIRANDNYRVSELGLKSGNYLRMKDVVLGYTIPKTLTEQIGMSNLKFYISGRNLLTFTKFDGVDPEESGTSNLTRGVIFNNYPQSKSVVLGANITF